MSRYGGSQYFLEQMAVFAWVLMGGGLLLLVAGAVTLEWIVMLVGAGLIAGGAGYRRLAEVLTERALRKDFQDRWRR
ncbi:hypothetical protein [Actinomadura sp. 21ATH]|uniref:hypothetical protein n=1 Tax=Actinomadura sp. 21ATH TaxID=1735444 RepID=UPI0035BFA325